jgi:hypothetical protein
MIAKAEDICFHDGRSTQTKAHAKVSEKPESIFSAVFFDFPVRVRCFFLIYFFIHLRAARYYQSISQSFASLMEPVVRDSLESGRTGEDAHQEHFREASPFSANKTTLSKRLFSIRWKMEARKL